MRHKTSVELTPGQSFQSMKMKIKMLPSPPEACGTRYQANHITSLVKLNKNNKQKLSYTNQQLF